MVAGSPENAESSVKRRLVGCFAYDPVRDVTFRGTAIYGLWMICWQAVPRVLLPVHCFLSLASAIRHFGGSEREKLMVR